MTLAYYIPIGLGYQTSDIFAFMAADIVKKSYGVGLIISCAILFVTGVAIGSGIMAYTNFLEPVVGGSRQAWSVCFAILAQAIFLGVLVYYLRYTLDLNDTQVSLVNIIMWIVALFWVFPINRWSTKYFKVVSWTISMGIWLLCMIVFPLFFLKPGSTAAPIIMTSILVVGLNALYQVIYAMISDCVEVDELMSGAAFETGGERDYFR